MGETLTLTDDEPANVGGDYQWVLVDVPVGSSAALVGATTPSPTVVTDATGSILVSCTVSVAGVTAMSREIAAVPLAYTGARIPAYTETVEYDGGGNTRGWHTAMTLFMRQADTLVGMAQDGVGAGMTLVETQEVSGSAVGTMTFSGLDGDVDDTYMLVVEWVRVLTGDGHVVLLPNNLTTNQGGSYIFGGGLATAEGVVSRLTLAVVYGTPDRVDSTAWLRARTGHERRCEFRGGYGTGSTASTYNAFNGIAGWSDTATNITSLVVASVDDVFDPATDLGVGTRVSLYRIRR